VWDARERALTLARDRFGEKPLYYGWAGDALVFGSELKALRAHPGFTPAVCHEALADYLRFAYVPAPRAIYRGTFKLPPGCLLTIRGRPPLAAPSRPLAAPAQHDSLELLAWWSVAEAMQRASREPLTDDNEAIALLEQRLSEAVQLQSLADVPLGAFLSGGVDSATIVALMQRQSSRRVQTFTVGFREQDFDEAPYSRAVARHLGTEHHELGVSPEEARAVIPQLPAMYDEPFADSSQIPTHLVCRAARQRVTVALSGDAGDELFGGYNRYLWAPRIWRHVGWLPHFARQALSHTLRAAASAGGQSLLPMPRVQRPTDKARKLAAAMRGARSVDDLYTNLVACWPAPQELMADGSAGIAAAFPPPLPRAGVDDARSRMMYWDSATYLPDDILCKVDRAAMAISLETRVPFLDHRVAELAWRLPVHMKIRGAETKWALRQVLYRHVPRELIERPKSGFAIPLADWLRGPLRGWAEDLLDERRLRAEGFFRPAPIREAWRQHLTGSFDWSQRLWAVLMFECWLAQAASPTGAAR
jgi:asparagine synthase (glutamine-hydrolysing)